MFRQLLCPNPLESRAPEGLRLLPDPPAAIEPQEDGLFSIIVDDALHELAHLNFDPQFFMQLPRQALLEGLIRLAFAAGEFPQTTEMALSRALSDEEFSMAKNQPRRDLDDLCPRCHRPMLL